MNNITISTFGVAGPAESEGTLTAPQSIEQTRLPTSGVRNRSKVERFRTHGAQILLILCIKMAGQQEKDANLVVGAVASFIGGQEGLGGWHDQQIGDKTVKPNPIP